MYRARARSLTSLSLLVVVLVLAASRGALAAERTALLGPLEHVKSSVSRVLGTVQVWPIGSAERHTEIARVAHTFVDADEMARRALGRHWQGLSRIEQEEFVRLFGDTFGRAVVAAMDGYTNETVTFFGEEIDGARARVRSRVVTTRGIVSAVDYRLIERGGRWAVYDITWDHSSVVANYRSQFDSIIRTSSVAELFERIRADPSEPMAGGPPVPDRFALGLLLTIFTKYGSPK